MGVAMVPRRAGCTACAERLAALSEATARGLERRLAAASEEASPAGRLRWLTSVLAETLDVERCSVLVPTGTGALRVLASSDAGGEGDTLVVVERYPELARALERAEPVLVEDVATSRLMRPVRKTLGRAGVRSVAAAPVHLGQTTAVLRVRADSRRLTPADLDVLAAAAHLAEHSIDDVDPQGVGEQAWSELVRSMGLSVLDVDGEGTIVEATGPLLEGRRPLAGRPMEEVVETIAGAACRGVLDDVLDGREPPAGAPAELSDHAEGSLPVEVWGVRVDALLPWTRWVLREAPGRAEGAPSDRETTMRATLERQQQEISELRTQVATSEVERARFISSSAHELKTPLTVVQSYLEILLSDLCRGLSDEQLSFVRIAYESVLRLRRLVIDLVDLAGLASGKVLITIDRVDVASVLEDVVHEMRPLGARSGVAVLERWPAELPFVRADADRLRQVFRNLLDNAIKHTPAGGHVRLEAEADPHSVLVSVEDDGVGVPPDHLPHVFDEFVQLHGPNASDDRGSGLGLAICQRIVRALGGRISVSSVEGEGTRFEVFLPRWPAEGGDEP